MEHKVPNAASWQQQPRGRSDAFLGPISGVTSEGLVGGSEVWASFPPLCVLKSVFLEAFHGSQLYKRQGEGLAQEGGENSLVGRS